MIQGIGDGRSSHNSKGRSRPRSTGGGRTERRKWGVSGGLSDNNNRLVNRLNRLYDYDEVYTIKDGKN